MNKKIFIIALLAMVLFAVEGYAQRERGSSRGSGRGQARIERPRSSSVTRRSAPVARYRQPSRSVTTRSYSRPRSVTTSPRPTYRTPSRNNGSVGVRSPGNSSYRSSNGRTVIRRETSPRRIEGTSRGSYASRSERLRTQTPGERRVEPRRDNGRYRSPARRPDAPRYRSPARRHIAPPPPHRPWRPVFGHHHSYWHHRHHCYFNDWYWYSWGGYRHRFICHRLYHNRFFDSLLGYYLWGTLTAPTRLDIGNMSFTRYGNSLKIQAGSSVSYLDLYRHQTVSYTVNYTTVDVTTGNGSALIYFYDEYGNEATYRL